jgi:tRNA A-37 threonylcarbamoyl transferase component Bud32
MEPNDRVLDLVARWERLRQQGEVVTPHDLCPDDPELRAQFEKAIERLQGAGKIFDIHEAVTPMTPPPGPRPDPLTGDYHPAPAGGESGPNAGDDQPHWIGKYRVVEHLGQGGQAVAYRAVHPQLPGRDVVIKWAKERLPEPQRQQLLAEGRVLADLEETGVARVYDVGLCEDRPFVVMEYLRGRTLQQVLAQRRPSPREAAALVAALAASLDRVHRRGVCHRDLKPSNVLIDDAGRPRLVDFGLALVDRPWDLSGRPVEGVSGTFQYMAPEQANGQTERIGPQSDVFGLGGILYALLTGRPPYQDADVMGVWEKARQGIVTPPRQLNPHIPRALERICLKALAFDPAQRYASAGHFAAALRGFGRRRWFLAALGGAAAFLALAAVLYQAIPWPVPKPPTGGEAGPLTGELVVRVWTPQGDRTKSGLRLGDPGALPVRNGEWLRLEAQLNRPGYVYLLWADSEGRVSPLYPWNSEKIIHDLQTPPPEQPPRQAVTSPAREKEGWRIEGKSGLETLLLLARETPWPWETRLADVVGKLPAVPLRDPLELAVRGYDAGQPVGTVLEWQNRGPNKDAEEIDDPLLQLMDRLRPHFPFIRAVRFAHQGD